MTLQNLTKNILFVALFIGFISFLSSCSPSIYSTPFVSQKLNQEIPHKKQKTQLIGLSTRAGLKKAPYNEWFDKNYADYVPKKDFKKDIKGKMKGVDVKVFMGTWCGDSKKEVPRFYKLMDAVSFDENRIQLVNLNSESPYYKQSQEGFEKGLNIHRVPTFIFYKNGEEIGRIVEHPVTSLETDISQILHGFAPAGRYPGVAQLETIIASKGAQYVYDNAKEVARSINQNVRNEWALNTYAYVAKQAKETQKALAIFKVNSLLFDESAYIQNSLGRAYWAAGDKEKAMQSYQKALEIKPNDQTALKMIEKIKEG